MMGKSVVFYTNILSPHQLPWCREFVKCCNGISFLYMAVEALHQERVTLGWGSEQENWTVVLQDNPKRDEYLQLVENCDVLICSLREFDLFRRRSEKGLITYYMFERWFKPPFKYWRMLHPGYFRMCKEALQALRNPNIIFLPIGIYAAQDMARMVALMSGDFRALFRVPKMMMEESSPMASIGISAGRNTVRMRLWGYFVASSEAPIHERENDGLLKLLWCGRMLDWKRVETAVKAVVKLLDDGQKVQLKLVGHGPEESKLKRLAGKWLMEQDTQPGIIFMPPVDITEVRKMMRNSDAYILPSDETEGWGAVVNEAMTEGCVVVGTYEAGSSATMLQEKENGLLFHAGKITDLYCHLLWLMDSLMNGKQIIMNDRAANTIRKIWSSGMAAQCLFNDCQKQFIE